ncbi:hypothetical protein [Wolbachia endosymbiont (group A) of Scambus nigricans]|uniref:hypothetical protein n=1 Tax=Wolbachia endosymbiont (group A) of Scambus nigricans TaxID=2954055 RepID=UPI00222FB1C9|nr:hypothetical protein [Wolbachia endosymbiont (group A) of Scambus nigricans]
MNLITNSIKGFYSSVKSDLDWQAKRSLVRTLVKEVNIDLDKVDVVFKIKELENPAQNGQNQKMVHCLRGLGTGMTSFFLVQITLMSQYLYSCVIGRLMFTTQEVHTVVSQAVG